MIEGRRPNDLIQVNFRVRRGTKIALDVLAEIISVPGSVIVERALRKYFATEGIREFDKNTKRVKNLITTPVGLDGTSQKGPK